MLNQAPDLSREFSALENTLFLGTKVVDFQNGRGRLRWNRHTRKVRTAFVQSVNPIEPTPLWEFPNVYAENPELSFAVDFVSPRVVRIRCTANPNVFPPDDGGDSPMLSGPLPHSDAWSADAESDGAGVIWRGPHGSLRLRFDPWKLEWFDAVGKPVVSTWGPSDQTALLNCDPMPFSFIRTAEDLSFRFAATFALAPDEKLFGCGESFRRLDRRGQKLDLFTCDAHGTGSARMYKPVPFFLSSRGYGMFVHATTPMTFDFGHDCDAAATLYNGDETLDLFVFLGSPAEILEEYTALTGRSPMPPLWSFGLWMSRITYKSEAETREVADNLRQHAVPCDVIHLDTGWFDQNWICDYRFSETRFPAPEKMIADLRRQGFRISLWQLPYFTPGNPLYQEAVERGYAVRRGNGAPASSDAVVDFSNPEAVRWYQALLASLLRMGVGAIKADFGEGAPLAGLYASGQTGWHEHNLYPLRYNRAVAEVTREVTGEDVIWGRSAWAGSQRYPLHWGGDAENSDVGMAASLRGGLSLGLCGFTFWSHDIGGFVKPSPEALYRRWLPFGMLTSHSRCHGAPPKEPWAYSESFVDAFRRAADLKYRLMPYIYTQSKIAADHGWPLLRPLFFDHPGDPGSWRVEDEYHFGADLLVAPLFDETTERAVYLPPGLWHDYQNGERHVGGCWRTLSAGTIPCVILVRDGTALPCLAKSVQHTGEIDWNTVTAKVFDAAGAGGRYPLHRPGDAAITWKSF